jgi:hypothetical protein
MSTALKQMSTHSSSVATCACQTRTYTRNGLAVLEAWLGRGLAGQPPVVEWSHYTAVRERAAHGSRTPAQ